MKRGKTLLLTTHFLEESDALSDRLLIISAETIRADGTPAKLKEQYGSGNPLSLPPLDLFQDISSWSTNPPRRAPKRLSSISVVIYLTLLRRLGRQLPILAAALRRDDQQRTSADQQPTSGGWNGEVPRLDDRSDLSTCLANLWPRDIAHSTILRRWCVQVKDGQFSRPTDEQRIRRRCQRSVSHGRSRSAEEESDDQCSIRKFQYSDQCPHDQYNERILHVSIHTSNARHYDSLDPRLNVLKALFSMRFVALNQSKWKHYSAPMRSLFSRIIIMNFNHPPTYLDYLRELI